MRITNQMMARNFMNNLTRTNVRMDRLTDQLATGKRITRPSHDPIGTLRSMQINTVLNENDQYIKNIDQASAWLEVTDISLSKAGDTLQRARELAVFGANGTLDAAQYKTLADEIDQLKDHIRQVGNSALGDRFIFAGQQTLTPPFEMGNNNYNGDYGHLFVEISQGVRVEYNLIGEEIFVKAFEALDNLSTRLRNSPGPDHFDISAISLKEIDEAINLNLENRSEVGSKVRRFELAKNRYVEMNIKYTDLLSKTEDVDVAETIMKLKLEENVQRAALATGARIIQPSLVDFLK